MYYILHLPFLLKDEWMISLMANDFFPFSPENILYFKTVSAAVLGGYAGLIVLYKLGSAMGGKKKVVEEPAKAATTVTTTGGGFPGFDSPDFDKFLQQVVESEEQLMALVESAE
jgi:hypothetical protein